MEYFQPRFRFLFVLLALGNGCGQDTVAFEPGLVEGDNAIIGGTQATDADYPAVGALLMSFKLPPSRQLQGNMICTGTLIAPDVFLVAAHCIDEDSIVGSGITINWHVSFSVDVSDFGVVTLDLPADTYEVAGTLKHPLFDPTGITSYGLGRGHDVGLVFLKTPVSDRTPAVVLGPNDADQIVVDTPAKIVGYGIRDPDYDPQSAAPMDGGIKYLATSVINEVGDTEMQIGTQPPTPQKCIGDSGGPTFLEYHDGLLPIERVVGVTSRAYDASNCHRGGIDTRVDAYRSWIDIEMANACATQIRTACQGEVGLALPAPEPAPADEPSSDGGCSATARRSGHTAALVVTLAFLLRRGLGGRRRQPSSEPRRH